MIVSGDYPLPQATPTTWAAAAIYAACRHTEIDEDRRTQCQIAEVVHVTEVSIRNRYGDLVEAGIINRPYVEEEEDEVVSNVYIVTNESFEGWVKFGKANDPVDAYGGQGRYSPHHPFVVEWIFPCINAIPTEGAILDTLRGTDGIHQSVYGTEWFDINVDRIKQIIEGSPVYLENSRGVPINPNA